MHMYMYTTYVAVVLRQTVYVLLSLQIAGQ